MQKLKAKFKNRIDGGPSIVDVLILIILWVIIAVLGMRPKE